MKIAERILGVIAIIALIGFTVAVRRSIDAALKEMDVTFERWNPEKLSSVTVFGNGVIQNTMFYHTKLIVQGTNIQILSNVFYRPPFIKTKSGPDAMLQLRSGSRNSFISNVVATVETDLESLYRWNRE